MIELMDSNRNTARKIAEAGEPALLLFQVALEFPVCPFDRTVIGSIIAGIVERENMQFSKQFIPRTLVKAAAVVPLQRSTNRVAVWRSDRMRLLCVYMTTEKLNIPFALFALLAITKLSFSSATMSSESFLKRPN